MINIHLSPPDTIGWLESAITLAAVLLGGFITYGTTHYFERRRERERHLGLAYQLLFNVQKMANDLAQLNAHVLGCVATADQSDPEMKLWSKVTDFIGFSDVEIKLSAEELALIATTKNSDLVMALREVESAHAIALQSFRKLSEMKNELGTKNLAIKAQGHSVSFEIPLDDYPKIAPLIINLDTLANSLIPRLPRMAQRAQETAEKLGPYLKKVYKFDHFVEVKFNKIE